MTLDVGSGIDHAKIIIISGVDVSILMDNNALVDSMIMLVVYAVVVISMLRIERVVLNAIITVSVIIVVGDVVTAAISSLHP